MAQKGRNDLESVVNSKIYDNANKEIIAQYVREVLEDYRDSHFNLTDDKLKDLYYEGNTTLAQKLAQTANVPPLWGKTQKFDPGSASGNFSGSNEGIVSSVSWNSISGTMSKLIINLSQSIAGKKISVNLFRDGSDPIGSHQLTLLAPIIRTLGSTTIEIGFREIQTVGQHIRLEILAFTIQS